MKPLSILLAPDSFKGSLSAVSFCEIAERTLRQIHPDAHVVARPMSDGGEGFIDSFVYAGLAEPHSLWVANPLGRKTKATYAWQPQSRTAIIEMAQASGLTKIRPQERNPMQTHSYGTGQLIDAALKRGAEKILIGLGGSATNDGGAGALQALGVPLLDAKGRQIGLGGQSLKNLKQIGPAPERLRQVTWQLACDVTNPLLGPEGATRIFGPQKGVTEHNQDTLETGLANWADCIEAQSGMRVHDRPGCGAAGGMAAGFAGLLGAEITPGFDLISPMLGIESLLENQTFDYILTGEGQIDAQTRYGKLPFRIAQLGTRYRTPTISLCGSLAGHPKDLSEFHAVFSIVNTPMFEIDAIQQAPALLEDALYSIFRLLKPGIASDSKDS